MSTFWVVTLFQAELSSEKLASLQQKAVESFESLGIEEFSLIEAQVDEILGERSYSGGDLPEEVLEEVESVVKSGPLSVRFFFSEESNARGFHRLASTEVLSEIQIEECPAEDWNAEWKKHYSPIVVNEQLTIVPAWLKDYRGESGKKLFINPGMGFGTGSHETTFLCLKLFTESVPGPVASVLDFGSGSGILGLAALLFQESARVDFYDIDPEANENCLFNAEINGLSKKAFRLLLPEVRDRLEARYEVVFGNILENVLIDERDFLVSRLAPGGSLIVSGLLNHQAPKIIALYSGELELVEKLSKGDWTAILFRRKG